ncbi:conserved hypothetical protein, partial [Ricinus communis]
MNLRGKGSWKLSYAFDLRVEGSRSILHFQLAASGAEGITPAQKLPRFLSLFVRVIRPRRHAPLLHQPMRLHRRCRQSGSIEQRLGRVIGELCLYGAFPQDAFLRRPQHQARRLLGGHQPHQLSLGVQVVQPLVQSQRLQGLPLLESLRRLATAVSEPQVTCQTRCGTEDQRFPVHLAFSFATPCGTWPVGTWRRADSQCLRWSSKKISAPKACRNGPLGMPARNSDSSMRMPQCRKVRITRSWAGAPRAVTRAVRIGEPSAGYSDWIWCSMARKFLNGPPDKGSCADCVSLS